MVRQTSIDSYNQIKENGLLSKRRMEVYTVLFRHGPLTANEVFVILSRESKGAYNAASNSAARFSELRDVGVIEECGNKICNITGMTVILWDVTSKLPIKLEKPKRTKCSHCNGTGFIKE